MRHFSWKLFVKVELILYLLPFVSCAIYETNIYNLGMSSEVRSTNLGNSSLFGSLAIDDEAETRKTGIFLGYPDSPSSISTTTVTNEDMMSLDAFSLIVDFYSYLEDPLGFTYLFLPNNDFFGRVYFENYIIKLSLSNANIPIETFELDTWYRLVLTYTKTEVDSERDITAQIIQLGSSSWATISTTLTSTNNKDQSYSMLYCSKLVGLFAFISHSTDATLDEIIKTVQNPNCPEDTSTVGISEYGCSSCQEGWSIQLLLEGNIGKCIQSDMELAPTSDNLILDDFDNRLDYLESVDMLSYSTTYDKVTEIFTQTIAIPPLLENVKNVLLRFKVQDLEEEGNYKALSNQSFSAFTNSTSTNIALSFGLDELESYGCSLSRIDDGWAYVCSFKIGFYQTEEILNTENSAEVDAFVILSFTLEIDVFADQALMNFETTPLAESNACNCIIRVDIPSEIVLFTDSDFSVLPTSSPANFGLGETIYVQHKLSSEEYNDLYSLELVTATLIYNKDSYEITTATNYCTVDPSTCSDGSVKLSFLASALSEDLQISITSLLVKNGSRRRLLDDESEGIATTYSLQITSTTTQSDQSSKDKIFIWVLISVVALLIIVVGIIGIVFKIKKAKVQKKTNNKLTKQESQDHIIPQI